MEKDMMEYSDNDFDMLIMAFIDIGNKLIGQSNAFENNEFIYAEGLGQKIISHVITVRQLYNGYRFVTKQHSSKPIIDFSSIAILTRASLETYLAFNYIFVSANDISESFFRFMCWDLAGYLERANIEPQNAEHQKILKSERKAIDNIKEQLLTNNNYKNLKTALKKDILKGEWRLKNSWSKLAERAGFNKLFFNQEYKFLCGYSHSSRLCIIQIQQTKDLNKQRDMARASVHVLKIVLAKYMFDYINLIPELKKMVDRDSLDYQLIRTWKEIGENL